MATKKIIMIKRELEANKSHGVFSMLYHTVKVTWKHAASKLPDCFSKDNIRLSIQISVHCLQAAVKDNVLKKIKNINLIYNILKSIQYTKLLDNNTSQDNIVFRNKFIQLSLAIIRFIIDLFMNLFVLAYFFEFIQFYFYAVVYNGIIFFKPIIITAVFLWLDYLETLLTEYCLPREEIRERKDDIYEKVVVAVASKDITQRLRDVIVSFLVSICNSGLVLFGRFEAYLAIGFICYYFNSAVKAALMVVSTQIQIITGWIHSDSNSPVSSFIDQCNYITTNYLSYFFGCNFEPIYIPYDATQNNPDANTQNATSNSSTPPPLHDDSSNETVDANFTETNDTEDNPYSTSPT